MAIALTSISLALVEDTGGVEIVVTGTGFDPTATCAVSVVGPIGVAAVVPCYSGKSGQGYAPKPRSATKLAFAVPALAIGTYGVRVTQGNTVTLAGVLDVVPHNLRSSVYALRALMPRRTDLGARSIDLEPPQTPPASPSFAAIADQEATQNQAFTLTPVLTNPTTFLPVFTLVGTLPTGLTINASTGVISGTPTAVQLAAGLKVRATTALHVVDSEAFDINVTALTLVVGATYVGDPDDASKLTLTGSALEHMDNQLGGILAVGGTPQTGVKPTIQPNVVNGRDVLRFIKAGALSGSDTNFLSNNANPVSVASIVQIFGAGALTTKTMHLVIKLAGISSSSLALLHPDADCVFAWMSGGTIIFGLWLREDTGICYAVIANNDGAAADKVEVPITIGPWLILTLWHDGTNIKIKLDGGAWVTLASGPTFADATDGHFGYNSHSAKGIAADVAYLATYNIALSDDDVQQNVDFLTGLITP